MASTISAGTTSGTAIAIAGDTSGSLALQTNNGTTAVTIDTSQNVGIGTASPSRKLQVHEATAATNAYFQLSNAATGSGATDGFQAIVGTGGEVILVQRENAEIQLWTNNTERMRIDTDGNLLVNTTAKFGTGFPAKIAVLFDDSTTQGMGFKVTGSASGADYVVFRNSSNTNIGSITRNGTSNAVLFNTTSDYRLKENVTPLTNALDKVSALKPVSWIWKDCDGAVGEGFIAHEVQEIVPNAVNGAKDAVDEEGNIKPQGMDASYLVATLTAAIQELNAKVDAQALEIQALKGVA
jgi:hypothetical protein